MPRRAVFFQAPRPGQEKPVVWSPLEVPRRGRWRNPCGSSKRSSISMRPRRRRTISGLLRSPREAEFDVFEMSCNPRMLGATCLASVGDEVSQWTSGRLCPVQLRGGHAENPPGARFSGETSARRRSPRTGEARQCVEERSQKRAVVGEIAWNAGPFTLTAAEYCHNHNS